MAQKMKDHAWAWQDHLARFTTSSSTNWEPLPNIWVIDCPDCGQLRLPGMTEAGAIQLADMHNAHRHGPAEQEK